MSIASEELRTERLVLRPLAPEDVTPAYVGWLNDPEVGRFLETRFRSHGVEDVRDFVLSMSEAPDSHLFGIFLGEPRRHIGNIKIGPVLQCHRLADVSLLIGEKDCWGQGYAAEAISAVSAWAFGVLGLNKLSASMYAPNRGSARAFERAGYRREGLRRRHYILEGQPCDLIEYGLCADAHRAEDGAVEPEEQES